MFYPSFFSNKFGLLKEPMDLIRTFIPTEWFSTKASFIFIGTIGKYNAIYTLPHPNIKPEAFGTDILETLNLDEPTKIILPISFTSRLIYPATEKHISKFRKKYKYTIETLSHYLKNNDFLKTSWIDNIILKKDVIEAVHVEDDRHIIISDYRWDGKSVDQMYLLAIFKNSDLRSLRDLDATHLDLLKIVKKSAIATYKALGLTEKDVCMYFHYKPSYFRLHLHIVNIKTGISQLGHLSRLVFLDDVILNLELDTLYFKRDCHLLEQC